MKKFLLLIAFAMIALVGCKDGDTYPLNNTVWKGPVQATGTTTVEATLFFYQTTFKINAKITTDGQTRTESSEGTYIYSHPRVSMTRAGKTTVATIDGNKIESEDYSLTRQ